LDNGNDINSITKYDILYTICDQSEWNDGPNQKTPLVYIGIRLAKESGFTYKFETYDYPRDDFRGIHHHKYEHDVIDHIISPIFWRTERVGG
jgi:hypothetical protein